ncbi:hypothetical protein pb186bvf_011849 [Paramecium bursaria]
MCFIICQFFQHYRDKIQISQQTQPRFEFQTQSLWQIEFEKSVEQQQERLSYYFIQYLKMRLYQRFRNNIEQIHEILPVSILVYNKIEEFRTITFLKSLDNYWKYYFIQSL